MQLNTAARRSLDLFIIIAAVAGVAFCPLLFSIALSFSANHNISIPVVFAVTTLPVIMLCALIFPSGSTWRHLLPSVLITLVVLLACTALLFDRSAAAQNTHASRFTLHES